MTGRDPGGRTVITIGILSDTHLIRPSEDFTRLVASCFAEARIILHAGDLTDPSILTAFGGKEVYAVHGNMCSQLSRHMLPASREIRVGGFSIGLIHRVGNSHDFEDRLVEVFPEADCIVYGHTHLPVCHRIGRTLYINPGSFTGARYQSGGGTYALLEVGETIQARIFQHQGRF